MPLPIHRNKARFIMLGGFLGAGKTTAIIRFAQYLRSKGRRVGLITNDQSIDLVDTARVRAAGFPVEEITGGCFCCKFDSLVEASGSLTRETAPDVMIAEPVGSCTDLKATVAYPLRKMYGEDYQVAPLAVLVDPARCARVLGVTSSGGHFSEKVVYVYRKQLEEAEIIVVNNIDTLDNESRQALVAALRQHFPKAQVFEVSCKTGEGLEALFDRLAGGDLGGDKAMEVDYDLYADGEALLGWLNARIGLTGNEFDGNALLVRLAGELRQRLTARGVEIAHLKMTLIPDEGPDMASISLVSTGGQAEPTHTLKSAVSRASLLLNLRAETDPEFLREQVTGLIQSLNDPRGELEEIAAFRPGRPTPTHRMADAATAV
jgi:Ni2+-binding GTPase involved in maturation of urease and hydrogenase